MQLAKRQASTERVEQDHKIARFKAKYGVSNAEVSTMLNASPRAVRLNLTNDSFSMADIELMSKVEKVIERTVAEARLLQDHAPFLEVLRHDNERLEHKVELLKVKIHEDSIKILGIKNMGWKERLIFLFSPIKLKNKL